MLKRVWWCNHDNDDFHLETSDCEQLKIQISCSSVLFVPAHVTWHLQRHHDDEDEVDDYKNEYRILTMMSDDED